MSAKNLQYLGNGARQDQGYYDGLTKIDPYYQRQNVGV